MKLFRIEVERTEWTLIYIQADDPEQAEELALHRSIQEDVDYECEGNPDVRYIEEITSQTEGLTEQEWPVDNDPENRDVAAWLADHKEHSE